MNFKSLFTCLPKRRFILAALLLFNQSSFTQQRQTPKLVVGIVVDQMRYDYLTRFEPYFGGNGFKRLMNNGTNFTFAQFNYIPTITGPGHSSIYTGTTPFHHGIVGNDWYSRIEKKLVYCTEDATVQGVGTGTEEGKNSPKRLITNTITDQLKIATSGKSKIISLSIKDRASILPGGHSADGAFWYDHDKGNFITSTYYMEKLPQWVADFNNKHLPDEYLAQQWTLSLPKEKYFISSEDERRYETDVFSEGKTSFPHQFDKLDSLTKYGTLITTPFGNQLLLEFAKEAIINENLGKNIVTDFFAISFSSTDYIGHAYGPNSVEVQDTYIKLDTQIAELLNALDKQVGKGNYLLFLTADHGVQETVGFLKDLHIPAGFLDNNLIFDSLKAFSKREFKDSSIIENYSNRQIFFNKNSMASNNLDQVKIGKVFADYLKTTFKEIAVVYTRDQLADKTADRTSKNLILNGFNFERSGDIAFELIPYYLTYYREKGTSHSTQYSYDTHIPLIFFGWHIPKQSISNPVYIVDIVPTIANLIGITEPNGCIGIPILGGVQVQE